MKSQKPADFYTGAKVQAIYLPTGVPDFDGNPLIEALQPIMTSTQAAKRLSYFPGYNENLHLLDDSIRYQLLRTSTRFFTPLGIHIDLERRISCALRMSLQQRNPMEKEYFINIEKKVEKFIDDWSDQYNLQDDYVSTYAPGFNFVGLSGIGKSQTLSRILRILPQVIFHNNYKGRELIETQLVWLKLDCPFDGSIKALCLNFFQAVDSILGTNYLKTHAGGKRTATEMIPLMANVAANHHLGVFVIDEIQRLNQAASGGKQEMLNFFVQLVNSIGVAVILVGTYNALNLFDGIFSQMRRGTGQGDLVWDRMSFDKNWDRFIKSLWKYQFTRHKTYLEDNPDLSRVLYDESQGITDLAVKAYIFAQERAIETKKEKITASIIRSATRDKFQIIRPAIEAFRNKNKLAIKKFDDAYPLFLEQYMENYADWMKRDVSHHSVSLSIEGEISQEPEIASLVKKSSKSKDNINSSKSKKTPQNNKQNTGLLPSIIEDSSNLENFDAYDTLNNSGFTTLSEDLGFNSINFGGENI